MAPIGRVTYSSWPGADDDLQATSPLLSLLLHRPHDSGSPRPARKAVSRHQHELASPIRGQDVRRGRGTIIAEQLSAERHGVSVVNAGTHTDDVGWRWVVRWRRAFCIHWRNGT